MSKSKKYLPEGGITKQEEMDLVIKKHVADNINRRLKASKHDGKEKFYQKTLEESIKYYEGRKTGGTYGQRTYAREFIKVARAKLQKLQEREKHEQDKRSKAKKITR